MISAIKERAQALKNEDGREKDKNWLLIYQVWSKEELDGNGQAFLAKLKSKEFEFLVMPGSVETPIAKEEAIY